MCTPLTYTAVYATDESLSSLASGWPQTHRHWHLRVCLIRFYKIEKWSSQSSITIQLAHGMDNIPLAMYSLLHALW